MQKMNDYLLRGAVIWLPVVIIYLLVSEGIFGPLSKLGEKTLTTFVGRELLLFLPLPKVLFITAGLIVVAIIVGFTGFLSRIRIFRKFFSAIPVINFFMGNNGATFSKEELEKFIPCRFLYTDTVVHWGFITGEQKIEGLKTRLVIFRPNLPMIFTGDILEVKREFVMKLGNSSGHILEKLIKYGKVNIGELKPVRWEDGTPWNQSLIDDDDLDKTDDK